MNGAGFLAVGAGAALGAWLRWGLGILLNPLFPTLPLGTLAANLVGGYLIGVAVEVRNPTNAFVVQAGDGENLGHRSRIDRSRSRHHLSSPATDVTQAPLSTAWSSTHS